VSHSDLRRPSLAVLAALGLAWSAAPIARAADSDRPVLRAFQPPYFTADLSVTVDSTTRARVRVTISVPYSELNWERDAGAYTAGAGFMVELRPDRGPKRLYGDSWERRIKVVDHATTVSYRNLLMVTREFEVPPANYQVRVAVQDVRAREVSEVSDQFQVRDLSKVPVGFADLELGVVGADGAFTPVPSRAFGSESGDLGVRAVVMDRRAGPWPRQYRYHWRVVDESGGNEGDGDSTVTVERSTEPVVLKPAYRELFLGQYTFELELRDGKTQWRTSRTFEVEESGPPHGRAFEELLEALAYIAPSSEVDAMSNLKPEEQAARWEAFWRRRDPTPETARNEYQIEFFRRLRYADQHFLGFGPGWRSDMGRIYIRYGPPDQVEQRQASATTPGLEIWYYNQPYRRLVFMDREGFGRFTLSNPPAE